MVVNQKRSKRKVTGGRYIKAEAKRLSQKGSIPTLTKLAETKVKQIKSRGGNSKERLPLTGPKLRHQRLDKYSDFAGRYTLAETITRMQDCDYFIANDSGLMHIAATLGGKTVGLFGPTNWQRTSPYGANTKIIRLI